MRQTLIALTLILSSTVASTVPAQDASEIAQPPNGNNQRAEVSQWIGPVQVSIAYHSPRVHFPPTVDRTGHIWGELVDYGFFDGGFGPSKAAPWRAGANESTTITVSHDVKVDGQDLKAGTYALFLELQQSGPWTWIFSKRIGWGAYQYDSTNDVLRVSATPQDAPFTEFLTYGFDDRLPGSAVAFLQWEKKRITFKIDVPDVNEVYIAELRKQLLAWPGFNYQNWQAAADFAASNKIDLDEALVWANKAIYEPFRGAVEGREDFSTLQTKAAVLEAMGRDRDADTLMDRTIRLPGTSATDTYRYAAGLLGAGRKDRAQEIFLLNRRLHPDERFWTFLGLARGYTAVGAKEKAISSWETAIHNVPPNLAARVPAFQKALQALKESK